MKTIYIAIVRILGALIATLGAMLLFSMSQLPLANADDIFTAIIGALMFSVTSMTGGITLIRNARLIVTQ